MINKFLHVFISKRSPIVIFWSYVLSLSRIAITYLLPARCIACSNMILESRGFCPDCIGKIDFITKPYCKCCGIGFAFQHSTSEVDMMCGACIKNPRQYITRSVFRYEGLIQRVIHSFKYHDKTGAAKIFAHLMLNLYKQELEDADIITAVPMHKLKRLMRMYNQSELIAKHLAKLLQKECRFDLLKKCRMTKSQTGLSRKMREKNLSGSIKINNARGISGKKIVLIDDVLTTGSTIRVCCKELQKAKARVLALTVART